MLEKPFTGFNKLLNLAEKQEFGLLHESGVFQKASRSPASLLTCTKGLWVGLLSARAGFLPSLPSGLLGL